MILPALTLVGPMGQSLPITIVQAASLEVLLFGVTARTLIRCNCGIRKTKDIAKIILKLQVMTSLIF